MPTLQKITLRNFKGAKEVEIDFGPRGERKVVTLIGLNESGKTTILEGLSHFANRNRLVEKVFEEYFKREVLSLIPIDRKAAFSKNIDIAANIVLDDDDRLKVTHLFEKKVMNLKKPLFQNQLQ